MAYRKVGITAVMDIAGFMPNVSKFISSIQQMNAAVAQSAAKTGALSGPLTAVGSALGGIAVVAGGIISSQVFQAIANEMGKIVTEAIDAGQTFQLLEQRFKTLAARDYMRQTGADAVEALDKTSNAAQRNMEWLRKLAITTPYTVESLASMSAYAQAAGFTNTETKKLAQTIGDFSAGMGLEQQHVDRIIWNFSQMMSAGRVLGRELRDLGNSMVPVDYIVEKLGKEFGKSKEDIKEMLKSGEINARKFINTFNEMSESEFAGAMERQANTLKFAMNNVKDFIDTMLGLDILKPTFDVLGKMINDMLKDLMSDDARRASSGFGFALLNTFNTIVATLRDTVLPAIGAFFERLGIGGPTVEGVTTLIINMGYAFRLMGNIFARVTRAIGTLIESFTGMFDSLFTETVDNAHSWGYNLIINFAKGMSAAITYVLQALTYVAQTITKWLKPGSPPLLLPDIDTWGTGAMNAYLDGWKEADYTVFNDVSSMLEKYINAFDIPKMDILTMMLGGRNALATIMDAFSNSTTLPTDAIEAVTSAFGVSNEVLNEYIASLFKLKVATENEKNATSILSYELGGVVLIYGQIVDSLDEAAEAARAYMGAGREYVLGYIDALYSLQAAQELAKSAQEELNAVTKYYDDILAKLSEQQNKLNDDLENAGRLREIDKALNKVILTTEERERLELEKRGILLKREIRDTETAKKTAVDTAQAKYDAAQEAIKTAEEVASAQKKMAEEVTKATRDQVAAQTEYYKSLMETMIKNMELEKQMAEEDRRLKEEAAKKKKKEDEEFAPEERPFEELDLNYESVTSGVKEAVDGLFVELGKQWDDLEIELGKIFEPSKGAFSGFITAITDLKETAQPVLEQFKENTVREFTDAVIAIAKFLKDAQPTFDWIKDNMIPILETLGIIFATLKIIEFVTWLSGLIGAFSGATGSIGIFGEAIGLLFTPVGLLMVAIATLITVLVTMGPNAALAFNQLMFIIAAWIIDTGKKFFEWAKDTREKIWGTIVGISDSIAEWYVETIKAWEKWGEDVLEKISDFATKAVESFRRFFQNLVDEFWNFVTRDIPNFITDVSDKMSNFVDMMGEKARDAVNGFLDGFYGLIDRLASFIGNIPGELSGVFQDNFNSFMAFGDDIISGIVYGLERSANWLYTVIADIVRNAMWWARDTSETGSPSKSYARLTRDWMLGAREGILENTDLVTSAIGNMVKSANYTMSSVISPSSSSAVRGGGNTYNRNISIEMNPTYKNIQSESSIRYDLSAALAGIRS